MKGRILISACLMGQPVRYDGQANDSKVAAFQQQILHWQQQQRLVIACPETLGGLPTPRPAAEIRDGRIISRDGDDFSRQFHLGAEKTLRLAQQHDVVVALLADRSPSCGANGIYDGSFSATLTTGMGVTAALLSQHGIRCFNPPQFDALQHWLQQHDAY